MKKTTKAKAGAARTGVTDFTELMFDGHPEWILFAVRGAIEEVVRAFGEAAKVVRTQQNVPVKPMVRHGEAARLTAFVAVKGNPWTVVLRSVFDAGSEEFEHVPGEAESISRKLKTDAITLMCEDTAGTLSYDLYSSGREVEKACWEMGASFASFKSTLRKQPKLKGMGVEFADELFKSRGIYLPACYPLQKGKDSWLAVDKRSIGLIERGDLVELAPAAKPKLDDLMARFVNSLNEQAKGMK